MAKFHKQHPMTCSRKGTGTTQAPSLWARLAQLFRRDDGIAAVEAAFILPIMIFFIFASIEAYQYFRVMGIMNRAAFSVADAIAMQPRLYESGSCNHPDHLCTYGVVAADLMQPLNYERDGDMAFGVYVTEAHEKGVPPSWSTNPVWSKSCTGAGSCGDTRVLDGLPAGMPTPKVNDSVLVVKIFQTYEPFVISAGFWKGLGGKVDLTTVAYTRTRFDDLKELQ